jgi:hypothetical protein
VKGYGGVGEVEAAYRRGDLFEKRRHLAEAWAKYETDTHVAPRGGARASFPLGCCIRRNSRPKVRGLEIPPVSGAAPACERWRC